MKIEYINPFVDATVDLFRTMMNITLRVGKPTLEERLDEIYDISGVIALAGGIVGMVVIRFPKILALRVTALYAGVESDGFDEFVTDTVAEITNVISANAKAALSEYQVLVSIPKVFQGKQQVTIWPLHAPRITVPFDCDQDRFTLTVGFKEAVS